MNMTKVYSSVVIAGIAVFLASAESPLFRQPQRLGNLIAQNNKKQSARHDQASASLPYPPAGITPKIPFDLPTETTQAPLPEPNQTYGPPKLSPARSYLPPDTLPDITYGSPEAKPDETYGPPYITKIYNADIKHNQSDIEEPPAEEFLQSGNYLVSENPLESKTKFKTRLRSVRPKSRLSVLRLRNAPVQLRLNTVGIVESEPVLY